MANVYLGLTVWLFVAGPWPWPILDRRPVVTYLILVQIALTAGFLLSSRSRGRARWENVPNELIVRIVLVGGLVTLALLPLTALARTGVGIPDLRGGLSNPGGAYASTQAVRVAAPVEYLRLLASPLLVLLVPTLAFYWRSLPTPVRILGVAALLGTGALFVAMGTNVYLFSTLFVLGLTLYARKLAFKAEGRRSNRSLLRRIAIFALLGALALFSFSFFTKGQLARPGRGAIVRYNSNAGIYAAPARLHFDRLPEPYLTGAIQLTAYLTQGYYGLTLAMEEPYVPTYGLGSSLFAARNASQLPGLEDFQDRPYPVRVSQHSMWNYETTWSSVYPWIASDFTFPGSLLIMLLLGYGFGASWNDSVTQRNPFAVTMLSLFGAAILYAPANNQLMQSGEGFIGFVALMGLWLWSRSRKKAPSKQRAGVRAGRAPRRLPEPANQALMPGEL